ncbi:MAG: ABC transporter ATP-binding protein [Thermodesulfovibrionales bacterium]|nr:ABC transporter ATP-binding protein [Thermodesulfovibrionales bacterium]
MIEIRQISKSFGSLKVLDNLSLCIGDKEIIAIIGRSGGGKSVFLKHIMGIMKPDSGSILIDGDDITKAKGKELDRIRNNCGVLFQGGALFDSMTVYENIAFPLKEKTRLCQKEILEKVKEALNDVGLSEIEDKYPAELSGGMKKRVALARALITEPKIILFDEPTTGLDPVMLRAIHKLILDTHKKYSFTGVIISHEIPEIFDVAHKVAMLYNGKIEAIGTPEEIKNSSNKVVRYFLLGETLMT